MPTPFDQKIIWLHWMGGAVAEESIYELAQTVKGNTPNAAGIAIKTSNGVVWQGEYDVKAALAITGPEAIRAWVDELAANGLETHLWCVLQGRKIQEEADLVIQACNVPGVRSMILDIEVGARYFGGQTAETARALITAIRAGIPEDFHLALCFDPRGYHPRDIHIQEWLPYVQSLHPMVYHWHFSEASRGPRGYLDDAFRVLAQYNLPIVPMLEVYADPATGTPVPPDQIYDAGMYSFESGAAGITYFRLGSAGAAEFEAVNRIEVEGGHHEIVRPIDDEDEEEPLEFMVVTDAVKVRTAPSLEPRTVISGRVLYRGTRITVDPTSREEADGYVWWRHSTGWSAERSIDGSTIFMMEYLEGDSEEQNTTNVPQPAFLFQNLPLDLSLVQWIQYYGNTIFAYNNGFQHNYHSYSQGLHGGFDLGHLGGASVCAGVEGVLKYSGNKRAFGPNRVDVQVNSYLIIYGHLANATTLPEGTRVTPDTVLGQIDYNQQHVHLEIRYQQYIYNPLLFMPNTLCDALLARFPAEGSRRFCSENGWDQWLTVFDQPVITLGGEYIGPPH